MPDYQFWTLIVLLTPVSIVCLCTIALGVLAAFAMWRKR